MQVNYFTFAVPVFIGAMVVEAVLTLRKRRPVYSVSDTFANLACGMGSQLSGLFVTALTIGVYAFVYDRWRLVDLAPRPWLAWVVALVGVDFIYYWWHRWSHERNVLWASHVVHHQSEEYNLSVALRQSWFGSLTSWPFYLPLALLGVPPTLYALSGAINLLYQFVIHTKTVRTLGPLEAVLNTPSHHRVHHGSNVAYLDRNYGGILIVWDRLFGSFTPEREPVEYGLVKPLRSFNPVWANVHYWVELAQASRRLPGLADKLRVWVKNPGWLPGDRSSADAIQRSLGRVYVKHELRAPAPVVAYLVLQLLTAVGGTVAVMAWGWDLGDGVLVLVYGGLVSGMTLWHGLLAERPWAVQAEAVRVAAVALALAWLVRGGQLPAAAAWVGGGTLALAWALLAASGRRGRAGSRDAAGVSQPVDEGLRIQAQV